MSEKKVKFNVIDALVLVVILAVIAFVGYKMLGKSDTPEAEPAMYSVSFYCEEVPLYAAEIVRAGDRVSDETKNVHLGKIMDVQRGEAAVYAADADGNMVKSAKEGYASLSITSEIEGAEFEHGIVVDSVKYSVGQSVTLYAGNAKMVGSISKIEIK